MYKVSNVIIHEQFSNITGKNDIALLRLVREVTFSPDSKIQPVCLPIRGESFEDYDGIVTGWGKTTNSGSFPDALQQVHVPILSNGECSKWTIKYDLSEIIDTWMCTGYAEGGKNPCTGDSGGPLHIRNNSAYYVVGIISFHFPPYCAQPKSPEIYTRVNKYLDWIADHTKDACPCNNVFDPSKNH